MEAKQEYYTSPIGITSQFRFCGNCFRIDTYKGCNFGCEYCFINNRHKNNPRMTDRLTNIKPANIKQIERLFKNAIDNKQTNTLEKELINRYTPLHLGGNSDPFQSIEKKHRVTFEFLKLSKHYQYPVMISTKTGNIEDEYFNVLDKNIHAFQISLISDSEKFIKKYEKNTNVKKRIELIKKLKSLGFWVSLRVQPLIDVNEALSVIKEVHKYIDFITIEHIKLQNDNLESVKKVKELLNIPESHWIRKGNSDIIKTEIKKSNIELIKKYTNIPIGCGDNDLHELSDTKNCCGIDVINENFNNWLKYNSMALNMGINQPTNLESKMNVFPYIKKDFLHTYDDYVKYYTDNIYKPYKPDLQKTLF